LIAIIDYGVGNLFSLSSSLNYLGLENEVTGSAAEIARADRLILPGVGAFGDAADKLRATGLVNCIREKVDQGAPMLGICLGMQLLFEKSYEYGEHEGLGLIEGQVCPLQNELTPPLKVPHIGWNRLDILQDDPIFRYIQNGDYVYYVHSFYAARCEKSTLAVSNYGVNVPGVVRQGKVYGMQFHPEKSGRVGLNLLRAFSEL
jgi:glutamine amidotransferase